MFLIRFIIAIPIIAIIAETFMIFYYNNSSILLNLIALIFNIPIIGIMILRYNEILSSFLCFLKKVIEDNCE